MSNGKMLGEGCWLKAKGRYNTLTREALTLNAVSLSPCSAFTALGRDCRQTSSITHCSLVCGRVSRSRESPPGTPGRFSERGKVHRELREGFPSREKSTGNSGKVFRARESHATTVAKDFPTREAACQLAMKACRRESVRRAKGRYNTLTREGPRDKASRSGATTRRAPKWKKLDRSEAVRQAKAKFQPTVTVPAPPMPPITISN
jgi:hypothetical protein